FRAAEINLTDADGATNRTLWVVRVPRSGAASRDKFPPAMLARFFRSTPAASPTATVPAGTRVYAIGDVHGRLDLLQELHQHIGDYIDRGHESRQTIDYLTDSPLPGFETVYLLGNHERTLLEFLDDLSVGPGWLRYGGRETLFSYDIEWDRDPNEGEDALKRI